MEKFNKTHLENIQKIVREKSGAAVMAGPIGGHRKKRLLLLTACFMCFAVLSAFAYMRFSGYSQEAGGEPSVPGKAKAAKAYGGIKLQDF